VSRGAVQSACRFARQRARIGKRVTTHSLRHSLSTRSRLMIGTSVGTTFDAPWGLSPRRKQWERRDSHSGFRTGFRTERENLVGDAKGKGASGSTAMPKSTDAPAMAAPAQRPRIFRQFR
jgi:hypothetical protein